MSKNVVVVTNRTGHAFTITGCRIKPLRETTQDQEFPFETENTAQEFTDAVNEKEIIGLSALFAGDESKEPELVEGELIEAGDETKEPELIEGELIEAGDETKEPELVEGELVETGDEAVIRKELEALTIQELKAKCKERGLSGYSKLKEQELIDLLVGNPETTESPDDN